MSGEPVSRRKILTLAGLGAAAVAGGTAGWLAGWGAPEDERTDRPASTGGDLYQPPVLTSRDGLLEVELTAAAGARSAGMDASVLGFNGTSPGPTLKVRPGDLLKVRLSNRLDQPTNLHTHGPEVSPAGNSDNPFVVIDPGDDFDYQIRIPDGHPPGTHWYHPHHHGTVADQLFGGLMGALVVDGGPDLGTSADRILLVSDLTLDGSGVAAVSPRDRMLGREGELVLVNGARRPVIEAAPGSSERWRVVNTCTSRVLSLRLEGHRLTQLSLDGRFLPAPVELDRLVLAPGNRADLLIRPREAGRYALITDPYDRGGPGMMGGPGPGPGPGRGRGNTPFTTDPVTLATLSVSGRATTSSQPPASLPAPSAPAGKTARQRRVAFQMGMGTGRGMMDFTIDGRSYDPDRDDQVVRLGDVEEWTVVNESPMDHPFHLHVWPVQVMAAGGGDPPAAGVRQDVVLIPARGWVRLRIPFIGLSGRTVYHCHILDHEDLGMMATVDVR
ncbi:multicopper oxidase family protein [Actinocorallia sp. B10E7]|uniref:multicopper oxidase family protein n=1 Tax=Actinocorallia sp. B10E7 TaxID=3153558 RepID=UPI00325D5E4E